MALICEPLVRENFRIENGIYIFIVACFTFYACCDLYECIKKIRGKSLITVKDKFQYLLGGIFLLILIFNLLLV